MSGQRPDLSMKDLIARWCELIKVRAQLKVQDDDCAGEIDAIKNDLYKRMEAEGMTSFKHELGSIYFQAAAYAKIVDAEKSIEWLESNNAGNCAPRKISLTRLKEYLTTAIEQDLPLPPPELMEINPHKDVRIKRTKTNPGDNHT